MNFLVKYWPGILIAFGGILAAAGSFISSYRNDLQQDVIKNTGIENNKLAGNNIELSNQIRSLQNLNNSIAQNTQDLVEENKNLASKNLALTEKVQSLILNVEKLALNVQDLADKTKNEITGGTSIPIVKAKVFYNERNSMEARSKGITPFDNKWIINFLILNSGDNSISKIDISLHPRIPAQHTKIKPIKNLIELIRSGDSIDLMDPIILADSRFTKIFSAYVPSYEIIVKWKVEYHCFVQLAVKNEEFIISDIHYTYKTAAFKDVNELKEAIEKDLKKLNQ